MSISDEMLFWGRFFVLIFLILATPKILGLNKFALHNLVNNKNTNGYIFIAFEEKNRIIRCPIKKEDNLAPKIINDCQTINEDPLHKINALRLTPDMKYLIVGCNTGIYLLENFQLHRLSDDRNYNISSISKIDGNESDGYTFKSTFFGIFNSSKYLTHTFKNRNLITTEVDIGATHLFNLNKIDYLKLSQFGFVVAKSLDQPFENAVYYCNLTNDAVCSKLDINLGLGIRDIHKLYISPQDGNLWLTGFGTGGGLWSFYGILNHNSNNQPFRRLYPWYEITDVISDGYTRNGVFVAGKWDDEICHMPDIGMVDRSNCFKTSDKYPIAIEINSGFKSSRVKTL